MRIILLFISLAIFSDTSEFIDKTKDKYNQLAMDLWNYAEMGYLETNSAKAIKKILKDEGFNVTDQIAGIPTAFVAEYGSEGPVIGILAEFDALPGLSQSNNPYRES